MITNHHFSVPVDYGNPPPCSPVLPPAQLVPPPRSGFPRSSLHATEDDGDKDILEADDDDNDELSADTQSYFTPEEEMGRGKKKGYELDYAPTAEDVTSAHVHAISSAVSTLPCHMTLTTGACSKAGCSFNHTPEVLSRHHEKMLAALRKPV